MGIFGIKDMPIEEVSNDMLGVEKYITGLSQFILGCDTPMTIAIQGDWGTGKTSFMNMVKSKLDDDVMSIWFNTWQFSQFNMENTLSLNLLSSLLDTLDTDEKANNKFRENLFNIGKFSIGVANQIVDNLVGINAKDNIEKACEKSPIESIVSLKSDFQNTVNESLKKNKKKRMVIFIDDLDRLNPEKAVEILEILKIFLDCKNCVFVLAIDYYVVSRGISKKYGDDFGSDKGKSFFDKIIQVPFKMPTAHYQIQGYIENCLEDMNFNKENAQTFTKLLSTSLGYNPRGMKRILNAFLLLTLIYKNQNLKDSYVQKVLFAVLCLQLSFEEAYNKMVLDEDDNIYETLTSLLNDSQNEDERQDIFDSLYGEDSEKENIDSVNKKLFYEFMEILCDTIKENSGCNNEKNVENFMEILKISGTTASVVNTNFATNGKESKGIRYINTFDEHYTYHKISELLDKSNKPTGWNSCKMDKMLIFNKEIQVSAFVDVMVNAIEYFYNQDHDKFMDIYKNCDNNGLYGLFKGSRKKNGFVAKKEVPSEDNIVFESKNNNNDKIGYLRKLFTLMGYDTSELKLSIKLAKRSEI